MTGEALLRPPRGTKDRLPEESYIKRKVCESIRKVFELYGYGEIETPAFEHLEVLIAKAGEEVVDQIYAFKDKAGRDLGLRFELTTPIARIVASRLDMPKPIRFYYIQPVWRYEEPQKGRLREFWQAGVELIGIDDPMGDAEVIAIAHRALRSAGLQEFEIHLSHRSVVEDLILSTGLPENRVNEALRALDKLDKKGKEYVLDELSRLGAERSSAEKMLEQLSSADLNIEVRSQRAAEGLKFLSRTLDLLESAYDLRARVDFGIVRGLGYYTGLVFEVKTPLGGEVGSVAGGGRYDDLISSLGGPRLPATGMAIGVDRLIEVLRTLGRIDVTFSEFDAVVVPVGSDEELLKYAIKVAETLRWKTALRVTVEYAGRSLSKTLEKAGKKGAKYAVIIGAREVSEGMLTLRDLENWTEQKLTIDEAVKLLGYSKGF